MGALSEFRKIAPAGICIVCTPCIVTGEELKWNVICVEGGPVYVNEFAGVPLTVKSVAWTLEGSAGSLRLIMKSTGVVLMMLLQAGMVVVTAKPTSSRSVKTSCWDWPLTATRPSSHEGWGFGGGAVAQCG